MEFILHICTENDWQAAQSLGEYRAESIATDGFIHCSRPDQIITVGNKYYPGQRNLVLLQIASSKLTHELCWEPVEADVFPHVYGPINLDSVVSVSKFQPDADGVFRTIPKFE